MKKNILWIFLGMTTACVNPTAVIKSDVEYFKKEHSDQIQVVQGRHRQVRYAWSGDVQKRPLIFVHGSPGSWEGWTQFLLNKKLQESFHLIAIDRPGYGGSGDGKTEPSLSRAADEVMSLLKYNKSHLPAFLVGHSYGGPVIAKAAMDHDQKVAGLIFVSSSVDPLLEKTKWYQYVAGWWPVRHLIPTALRVCNEEILALKEELQDMVPSWSKIRAKSIIIQGEEDDLVPKENVDFLKANLRADVVLQVVMVPDLNHFVPWKSPNLITDAIEKMAQAH